MVGNELNCTPGKRGETSGGGAFSRALLSDRREQARREELKMLDPATILKDWPLAILDQWYLRLNVRIAFIGSLRNNDVDAVVPFRKRSLPFLRHFDLLLRVFLLNRKKITTQSQIPDLEPGPFVS